LHDNDKAEDQKIKIPWHTERYYIYTLFYDKAEDQKKNIPWHTERYNIYTLFYQVTLPY
jgi:hypothetical protein